MDARKTVSIYEAKTHLSALVEEAAEGVEITITKHGKALAKLSGAGVSFEGAQNLNPQKLGRLGGFSDSAKPMSKREWLRQWKESDDYVAGIFGATPGHPKRKAKTSTSPSPAIAQSSKRRNRSK